MLLTLARREEKKLSEVLAKLFMLYAEEFLMFESLTDGDRMDLLFGSSLGS